MAGAYHWVPRIAARTFSRSQRSRRRIPRVRFVRNQITSVFVGRVGAERVERSPRGLRPRMLPLHHAPSGTRGAEHGKRALSIRREARHGPIRVPSRGDAGHGVEPRSAGLLERVDVMCLRATSGPPAPRATRFRSFAVLMRTQSTIAERREVLEPECFPDFTRILEGSVREVLREPFLLVVSKLGQVVAGCNKIVAVRWIPIDVRTHVLIVLCLQLRRKFHRVGNAGAYLRLASRPI